MKAVIACATILSLIALPGYCERDDDIMKPVDRFHKSIVDKLRLDILETEEIKGRNAKLKAENDKLEAEINDLKLANDALTVEIGQLQLENYESKTEVYSLKVENEKRQLENQELNSELAELNAENDALKSENQELNSELAELNAENDVLKSENHEMVTKVDELKRENEKWRLENQQLQSELAKLNADNDVLKSENYKIVSKIDEIGTEIGELKLENEKWHIGYQELNSFLAELNAENYVLKSENQEVLLKIDAFGIEIGELKLENEKWQLGYHELNTVLEELNAENYVLKSENQDTLSKNNEFVMAIGELESESEKWQSDYQELNSKLAELNAENDVLNVNISFLQERFQNLDYKDLYRNTIAKLIFENKPETAIQEMTGLFLDEIKPIIDSAFSMGNVHTEILSYVENLPFLRQETVGYQALYDAMIAEGFWPKGTMITLHYNVKYALEKNGHLTRWLRWVSNPSLGILMIHEPTLRKLINDSKKSSIEELGNLIRESSNLAALAEDLAWQRAYREYPDEIVEATFKGNFTNVGSLINFTRELKNVETQLQIYAQLFSELKTTHLLNLDVALELLLEMKHCAKTLPAHHPYYNIKKLLVKEFLLPSGITGIVFSQNFIKNKLKDVYMTMFLDELILAEIIEYPMRFVAQENGKSFRIYNVAVKRYLCVEDELPHKVKLVDTEIEEFEECGNFVLVDKDWRINEFYLAHTDQSGNVDEGFGFLKVERNSLLVDANRTENAVWIITGH